jgi:hypothetical protein
MFEESILKKLAYDGTNFIRQLHNQIYVFEIQKLSRTIPIY